MFKIEYVVKIFGLILIKLFYFCGFSKMSSMWSFFLGVGKRGEKIYYDFVCVVWFDYISFFKKMDD